MSYADEYDYDFDHPACLKYGDKKMDFIVIESRIVGGITEISSIVEMEFISQGEADNYCKAASELGFYTYSAHQIEDEN